MPHGELRRTVIQPEHKGHLITKSSETGLGLASDSNDKIVLNVELDTNSITTAVLKVIIALNMRPKSCYSTGAYF